MKLFTLSKLVALAPIVLIINSVFAASESLSTYYWNGVNGGKWGTGSNWFNDCQGYISTVPDWYDDLSNDLNPFDEDELDCNDDSPGSDREAYFYAWFSTSVNVDLDGNRSINDLTIEMDAGESAQIGQSAGDYKLTINRQLYIDSFTSQGLSNSSYRTLDIYSDVEFPDTNQFQSDIIMGGYSRLRFHGELEGSQKISIIAGLPTSEIQFKGGTDNYTGTDFSITGSHLIIADGEGLTLGAVVLSNSDAIITVNEASTFGGLNFAGTLNINDDLTIGSANEDMPTHFAAHLQTYNGSGDLIKTGTGTHTLKGDASSWTGDLRVEEGTVVLSGYFNATTTNDVVPDGSKVTVLSGATLEVEDPEELGGIEGGGTVQLDADLTIGKDNQNHNFSGGLAGSSDLIKEGGGRQTLSGNNNSFSGEIHIQSETIIASGGSSLPDASLVNVASSGTLNPVSDESLGSISGTGIIDLDGDLTVGVDNSNSTFSGTLTGASDLIKGGSGSLTVNASTSSFTGALGLSGGTLKLDGNDVLSDSAAFDVPSGTTLQIEATSFQSAGGLSGAGTLNVLGAFFMGYNNSETTFSGVISGDGEFAKLGNSTLHLSGTNTFAGDFSVLDGRVLLTSTGSLSSAANLIIDGNLNVDAHSSGYTIASGQTLAGSGSINGDIILASGSTMAPGNSAGAFETHDAATISGGFTYEWEVIDWEEDGGIGWDEWNHNDLTINATSANKWTIKILGSTVSNFSEAAKSFNIINDGSGGITGFDASAITIDATDFPGSGTWSVSEDSDNIYLDYTAPDTDGPVITLAGDAVMTVECGDTYTEPATTTAFDIGDNANVSVTISGSVDTTTVGQYILSYDAQDSSSNAAVTVTRTVNVVDTTAPVVTITGGNTMTLECNVDTFTAPSTTLTDNCDTGLTATTSDTVDVTTLGDYDVVFSATDNAGNTGTATLTVSVVDTTSPVISLTGNASITLECGVDTYTEQGATANDACDSNVSVIIGGDAVNTSELGTYTVTYNATDSSGNNAIQVSRTVIVQDTTAPVLTLNGDNPMTVECTLEYYSEPGVTVTEACDQNLLPVIGGDTVDRRTKGTYIVTYNSTDSSGNVADTVTRTVYVVDTTAPQMTLYGAPSVSIPIGGTFSDSGAAANDACDGDLSSSIVVDTSNINNNAYGSYEVTYSATDAEGNTGITTRQVLVTGDATWTGTSSEEWIEPLNWNLGSVQPGAISTVTFPASPTRFTVDLSTNPSALELIFNSTSNYTLNDGTLTVASGDITVSSTSGSHTINSGLDFMADATIDIAGTSTLTFAGAISTTENLTKQGSGNLYISNSLIGAFEIDVDAGSLFFTDATDINDMLINIASGATLDLSNVSGGYTTESNMFAGSGDINGSLTLRSLAIIAPGNSAGQLTTDDLSFEDQSTYEWEISDWTGSSGTDWDHIDSSGTVSFSGLTTIKISQDSLANFDNTTQSFEILSASTVSGFSSLDFELDDSEFTSGSGAWSISSENNKVLLTYSVPGAPVTAGQVTVEGDDSETVVIEGDFSGDTITVTGPASITEPIIVTLEFDSEQIDLSSTDLNVQMPQPGQMDIMLDSFFGTSATINIIAVDDPIDEGDHTSSITVSVIEAIGEPQQGTFIVSIIDNDTPYALWALANGFTLNDNDGYSLDSDNDFIPNIHEFAFDLDVSNYNTLSDILFTSFTEISNQDYYTVTFATRSPATFAGTSNPTAEVDGISYTLQGSSNLADFTNIDFTEITPAVTSGLPTLSAEYEYHTFRVTSDSIGTAFIRLNVEASE
ncbi:beta strand repeat-containing protein [Rubellicoccus peritrichatus]|uniref:DUF5011 domain-containing protein n=1 Tax=Rubellicoccus peritrichatus TaxID=3080537 RepID=A0AAQ3L5N8_9BACT|nr:immunoglobulin-like domain-containing protein [Puniceicoccus sp. CR14]WOO39336.1 DUF5011 domain-containing protein [Puniceicoccus sp. CR14]